MLNRRKFTQLTGISLASFPVIVMSKKKKMGWKPIAVQLGLA